MKRLPLTRFGTLPCGLDYAITRRKSEAGGRYGTITGKAPFRRFLSTEGKDRTVVVNSRPRAGVSLQRQTTYRKVRGKWRVVERALILTNRSDAGRGWATDYTRTWKGRGKPVTMARRVEFQGASTVLCPWYRHAGRVALFG